MSMKSVLIKGLLLAAVLALAVFSYIMGKSYDILLENLPYTYQGESHPAYEALNVRIGRTGNPILLLEGDRLSGSVIGREVKLYMDVLDINDEVLESRTFTFNIDELGNNLSVNIPRAFDFESLTE